MKIEEILTQYVSETKFEELPKEQVETIRTVILTILGTTIAGATTEGCEELVDLVKEWGGREEATVLIHGGKVPAYNAVLVNSTMARALDFCDAMIPGIHIGSSSVPTGLAVAELAGGCSGKDFLTALVLGTELASRINFSSHYDGFDPTGVCNIFAATAIAGRILHLNSNQMLHALALALNRAGGSMQSNIDGALSVRFIQGFASQSGVISAQLAQRGITGPENFLEGVYGYFHLYAKDKYEPQALIGELGERFELSRTTFKKYPSCGLTKASTDAILAVVDEKGITPEDISRIDVKVVPFAYTMVGHPFAIGNNPRVNAQFSIQFCVANALLRKSSKLQHFEEPYISDPRIMDIINKINVTGDTALEKRGINATDMEVRTKRGAVYHKSVDIPRGSPGNLMTSEEHMERFQDCVNYGGKPLPKNNIEKIISTVKKLEEIEDVCNLIPLLLS